MIWPGMGRVIDFFVEVCVFPQYCLYELSASDCSDQQLCLVVCTVACLFIVLERGCVELSGGTKNS